ncbi:MAG: hypothetical protein WBW16_14045 [Bacteroidota bacterium]
MGQLDKEQAGKEKRDLEVPPPRKETERDESVPNNATKQTHPPQEILKPKWFRTASISERVLILTNMLLVIFNGILAYSTYQLARDSTIQAEAAKNAAAFADSVYRLSKKTLDFQIESLKELNRPRIYASGYLSGPPFGQPQKIVAYLTFKNLGIMPALGIKVFGTVSPNSRFPISPSYDTTHWVRTSDILNQGNDLRVTLTSPKKITLRQIDSIDSGRDTVFVYGVATYNDIWGGRHWKRYCLFRTPYTEEGTAEFYSRYNDEQ